MTVGISYSQPCGWMLYKLMKISKKIYETIASKILNIRQQRTVVWERGDKGGEPCNYPSSLPWEFPSYRTGESRQSPADPSDWEDGAESPETKVVRIFRMEYQRLGAKERGNPRILERDAVRNPSQWSPIKAHEETIWGWGKNHPKEWREQCLALTRGQE